MSGNASRTRGRQRELRYRDHMRDEGWWCDRIDTGADLVALKPGRKVLLQVKSTVGRYSTFLPEDRRRLSEEARLADAEAILIWWPKNTRLRDAEWIPESAWPT